MVGGRANEPKLKYEFHSAYKEIFLPSSRRGCPATMQSPSFEVFKSQIAKTLGNLVWHLVLSKKLDYRSPEVHFNLNYSVTQMTLPSGLKLLDSLFCHLCSASMCHHRAEITILLFLRLFCIRDVMNLFYLDDQKIYWKGILWQICVWIINILRMLSCATAGRFGRQLTRYNGNAADLVVRTMICDKCRH